MPTEPKPESQRAPRTLKELRWYYQASQMTLEFAARQVDDLHRRCQHYQLAHDHLRAAKVSESLEKVEQLNYLVNFIRLPLKIDPSISNTDTPKMLTALNAAMKRLGAL